MQMSQAGKSFTCAEKWRKIQIEIEKFTFLFFCSVQLENRECELLEFWKQYT